MSGLYAGNGGVQVDVKDTTHLKGGVISSTGGDSHLNTDKLIAENQENHSKWDATSTGGGLNLGTDALGGSLGPLGLITGGTENMMKSAPANLRSVGMSRLTLVILKAATPMM